MGFRTREGFNLAHLSWCKAFLPWKQTTLKLNKINYKEYNVYEHLFHIRNISVGMMAEDQAPAVEAPSAVEVPPPKKKKVKKTQVKGQDSSAGKPKYRWLYKWWLLYACNISILFTDRDMVFDAITTQKERAGSSLIAIKNYLGSKYKVDVVQKAGALNRFLSISV